MHTHRGSKILYIGLLVSAWLRRRSLGGYGIDTAKPSIAAQEDRLRRRYKGNDEVQLVQSRVPTTVDGIFHATNTLDGNVGNKDVFVIFVSAA